MKQRQIPWSNLNPTHTLQALLLLVGVLFMGSCKKEGARITTVYGKVTDQVGQPVDSVTILFAGTIGLSAGFPIKETLTDSSGSYELVVDVPKEYRSAGINLFIRQQELLDKYVDCLVYENGAQMRDCCFVAIGKRVNYDFVLLPK